MSLSFQKDRHDPVKAFRRVQDFTWNMAKLQLLIEDSLHSPNSIMTTYKKFLGQIIEKESENDGKIRYFYQEVKFKKFQISKNNVKENYIEAIRNITACMEERFSNLYESPLFKHMVCMLDVSTWPTASSAEKFGDQEITEMTNYFANLFSTGPTRVDKIPQEWLVLKSYMLPIISNNKKTYYLNIWKIVFSNQGIVKECRTVFDIFELFLICPFTNAKLERMFSCMNRVKNDWRSSLSRDRLDVLLCVSEDGPSLEEFNPDASIDCWYTDKVCRLNAGPHNYPSKRKKSSDGKEVIDLAAFTLSDLENDESDEDVNFD